MSEEDQNTSTPAPARKVEKGPLTLFKEAQEVAEARAEKERAAVEERDRRQDERADKLVTAALDAERFTKRVLAVLLTFSLIANAVLTAMVLDRKLDVSKEGVKVGAEKSSE
ncbi:MAG TPA: hypothetical protein VLA34_08655 [Candidatus Krumholzibacterium sp.]|nr:hypothetical protein [Candidatus Krumholzibacterium sp.]